MAGLRSVAARSRWTGGHRGSDAVAVYRDRSLPLGSLPVQCQCSDQGPAAAASRIHESAGAGGVEGLVSPAAVTVMVTVTTVTVTACMTLGARPLAKPQQPRPPAAAGA